LVSKETRLFHAKRLLGVLDQATEFIKREEVDSAIALFENPRLVLYYSTLTKKECLGHRGLTNKEKEAIFSFLKNFRIIPVDSSIAQTATEFISKYKHKKLGNADALIAATALVKNMPLITRNTKHFNFIKEIRLNVF
jgi:predicted nucleic acid-binding protein